MSPNTQYNISNVSTRLLQRKANALKNLRTDEVHHGDDETTTIVAALVETLDRITGFENRTGTTQATVLQTFLGDGDQGAPGVIAVAAQSEQTGIDGEAGAEVQVDPGGFVRGVAAQTERNGHTKTDELAREVVAPRGESGLPNRRENQQKEFLLWTPRRRKLYSRSLLGFR